MQCLKFFNHVQRHPWQNQKTSINWPLWPATHHWPDYKLAKWDCLCVSFFHLIYLFILERSFTQSGKNKITSAHSAQILFTFYLAWNDSENNCRRNSTGSRQRKKKRTSLRNLHFMQYQTSCAVYCKKGFILFILAYYKDCFFEHPSDCFF